MNDEIKAAEASGYMGPDASYQYLTGRLERFNREAAFADAQARVRKLRDDAAAKAAFEAINAKVRADITTTAANIAFEFADIMDKLFNHCPYGSELEMDKVVNDVDVIQRKIHRLHLRMLDVRDAVDNGVTSDDDDDDWDCPTCGRHLGKM